MSLSFPFAPVSDVDLAFGGIPNYDEAMKACPSEFIREWSDNPWYDLAEKIFFFGSKKEELCKFKFRATSQEEVDMMWAYFRTWLGSYRPKHEDKIAVCGWLLSLMLTELPQLD